MSLKVVLFNNIYYFCDLFINIVFGDFLTLYASSYDVLASNWSSSDFHSKDPSSNLVLIIQLAFIIIESKVNL